jgi:hypothetical protein
MAIANLGRAADQRVDRRTGPKSVRGLARMAGRALVVAAMTVAVLYAVPQAHAQGRRMSAGMRAGPAGMGNTAITTREVNKWAEILGLTADQKEAVETLHQVYQDEYRLENKAVQDLVKNAQQEFMESQDTSAFKEVAAKTAEHTNKMTALDKQFMDDFKAVLEPKQAELWPKAERYHRRTKSLPAGMLAGESVNLVSITEDLDIKNESTELKDAIDQYEIDLDKALSDRDEQRKDLEKQSQDMMKDFDPSKMDFTKIRQMMQDTRKTGIRVRDVNDRHARLIAGALPADKKADFEQRVRKATYPTVYREPYTTKAIDAVLGFDDLTTEQKESVTNIKQAYERDLAAANDKWSAAVSEEEKDGGGDPFMGFGRFVPGGGGDDKPSPTEDAKKARRELDKSTLEKVKALLSESQQAKLPERENDNPWMMNFGGGGGDDADEKPAKAKPEKKK